MQQKRLKLQFEKRMMERLVLAWLRKTRVNATGRFGLTELMIT